MKSLNRPAPLVSRIAFVLIAAIAGSAAGADPIAVDNADVEPLPGRDYSMRLDLAAARFDQIDARSGEVHSRVFSVECAAALADGLWLAVPNGNDALDLLPLGATERSASATAVAAGCRTAPNQAATLPPALLHQIVGAGGGVIYVDNAALSGASQVAAREVAR